MIGSDDLLNMVATDAIEEWGEEPQEPSDCDCCPNNFLSHSIHYCPDCGLCYCDSCWESEGEKANKISGRPVCKKCNKKYIGGNQLFHYYIDHDGKRAWYCDDCFDVVSGTILEEKPELPIKMLTPEEREELSIALYGIGSGKPNVMKTYGEFKNEVKEHIKDDKPKKE